MYKDQYADCLEYIDNYWNKIIFKPSKMRFRYGINNIPILISNINSEFLVGNKMNKSHINIPHYYFVPNEGHHRYIFYWDSFFMSKGLIGTKREWLLKEMVDNFIYLFNTFQVIPNFGAPASLGRSQPPFFSSLIIDAYTAPLSPYNSFRSLKGFKAVFYKSYKKQWLKKVIKTAQNEYEKVWIDKEKEYNHSVDGYNLSRYGDRDIGYAHSSELESGWDMTSRFYNRCNEFLPIDLNIYLYKYELDFAAAANILKKQEEISYWTQKAEERKIEINKYMWNEQQGFFYDYGYKFKQQSEFLSLAGFTPMWAGLATAEQAEKMLKKLPKFETPFGLTITAKESLAAPIDLSKIQKRYHPAIEEIIKPKQWDYPNIWSPLEYLTVIGLLRYGYITEAKRIMTNSNKAHADMFKKYNTFYEKLNGITGEPGAGALYSDQQGFGWTNAAFFRYIKILEDLETLTSIYVEPKPTKPPYHFSILH